MCVPEPHYPQTKVVATKKGSMETKLLLLECIMQTCNSSRMYPSLQLPTSKISVLISYNFNWNWIRNRRMNRITNVSEDRSKLDLLRKELYAEEATHIHAIVSKGNSKIHKLETIVATSKFTSNDVKCVGD